MRGGRFFVVLVGILLLPMLMDAVPTGGSFRFEAVGPGGEARGQGTCDGAARLRGEVVAAAGVVHAVVKDGAGAVLLDERLGPGPVDRALRGAAGAWTMEVAAPALDGRFWFAMRC